MRAGHAGDWHAGELENAVIAMPPEPQDLEAALVWLSAANGQRQLWRHRALKAEADRARLVAAVRDIRRWNAENAPMGNYIDLATARVLAELKEGTDD